MSKTRKILSIVLAIVMVFGAFSVCSFAADVSYESETDAKNYTQTWALGEPKKSSDGKTWSVDVTLTTNYDTGAIQFVVENTDGNATLTGVTLNTTNVYYAADVSKTTKGSVIITPKTGGSNADVKGKSINGVIATLTYTVTDGKQAEIVIKNDAKSASNVGGSLIATRLSGKTGETLVAKSTMVVGQTATVGASKLLGDAPAATPELKVIEGTGGVIDTTRTDHITEDGTEYTVDGLLYGVEVVDIGEGIADVFEVENGTMNIVENDAGSDCGTGAKVQVLDNSGEVVATYVFILFGDLDGDGDIGSGDSALVEAHDGYSYDEDDGRIGDSIILLAGDLDADEEVGSGDAALIEAHDGYSYDSDTSRMSQAEIAELYAPAE